MCLHGPLDGLEVELDFQPEPGVCVYFHFRSRTARYPDWGGCTFPVWELCSRQDAIFIAVYRADVADKLWYETTLGATTCLP